MLADIQPFCSQPFEPAKSVSHLAFSLPYTHTRTFFQFVKFFLHVVPRPGW